MIENLSTMVHGDQLICIAVNDKNVLGSHMSDPSPGLYLLEAAYPTVQIWGKPRIPDQPPFPKIRQYVDRVFLEYFEMCRGSHRCNAVHTLTVRGNSDSRGPTSAKPQEHHTCRVYVRRVQDPVQHRFQIADPSHHVKVTP